MTIKQRSAIRYSQRFWLLMMDLTVRLFGFGSRPYLWAIGRAGACVDWAQR